MKRNCITALLLMFLVLFAAGAQDRLHTAEALGMQKFVLVIQSCSVYVIAAEPIWRYGWRSFILSL